MDADNGAGITIPRNELTREEKLELELAEAHAQNARLAVQGARLALKVAEQNVRDVAAELGATHDRIIEAALGRRAAAMMPPPPSGDASTPDAPVEPNAPMAQA